MWFSVKYRIGCTYFRGYIVSFQKTGVSSTQTTMHLSLYLLLMAAAVASGALLDGRWTNELHSIMELKEGSNGEVWGTYHTGVPPQVKGPFPLSGRRTTLASNVTALSFSVSWNNAASGNWHSATAWAGVLRGDEIRTTWLLAEVVEDPNLRWGNTRVGTNVFKRSA